MSALAVFFEQEGIATVVVGLVKLHLEKVQPPRALWVPFQLGRPLGAYMDSGGFQKSVLRSAFKLLERTDGPVILEDFNQEDPGNAPDPDWLAPNVEDATSLLEEVRLLSPRWQQARARLGRTMTGLSGMPIEQAADYVDRFDTEDPADNPNEDFSDLLRLRFCADDIRTYLSEAALSEGNPSSQQIGEWLWGNTRTAAAFDRIRRQNLEHENSVRALVCGKFLIPGAWIG